MSSAKRDVVYTCPNCHHPVEPLKPNAMLSAATQLWQHTDCWLASAPVVPPESTTKKPRRGSQA